MGDAMDEENGDHQLRSSDNTVVSVYLYDQIESGEWMKTYHHVLTSTCALITLNSRIRGVV